MTTYYFDSVNGSDANAGTSEALAKQDFNAFNGFTPIAGDTVLFKRGAPQISRDAIKTIRGGSGDSSAGRIRYGAYGVAQVPYAIWNYGTDAGNIILNAAGQSFLTFEDMYFDMRGSDCRYSINFAASGSSACSGHRIARCFFQGSNSPDLHIGNGLTISPAAGATGIMENYEIEDCEFFENDGHGLIIIGARNCVVRRCKFFRNGRNDPTGGHGYSCRYLYTAASSGWTNAPPFIWYRALTGAEIDVYYVKTSVGAYPRMSRTAGTQSTPNAGEFGVAAGVLYINVASAMNPSAQSVVYAWGRCYGLVIEDCESHDNYWNRAAPYHEGHGFAFDDFADDSLFLRNRSYNNEGVGFSINRGDRNKLVGCIAYGNGQAAVVCNPHVGTNMIGNTFLRNNTSDDPYDGEIAFNGNCKDVVISSNIIVSTAAYGIRRETSDTGFTGSQNAISGHKVAAEKNPSVTGSVLITPKLEEGTFRPLSPELKRCGAYYGGKDYNGKPFYNPPNIGAIDDVSATPRYGLNKEKQPAA